MAAQTTNQRRGWFGIARRPLLWATVVFLGAALLLGLSSRARAGADDFLLAFRVQQKTSKLSLIVAPIPALPGARSAPSLQTLASLATLQLTGGQPVAVVDDAQALLSFSITRLDRFPRPTEITVYQNATAQITPNQTEIGQLVDNITGLHIGADSGLPAFATTTIEAKISEAVRQRWDSMGLSLTYWQLQPPQLETSSGPSIEQLRSQIIQAYFALNPSVGQQLLSVQDWNHTVIVPVPPGANHRSVSVDHQPATLIETAGSAGPDSVLVWQRDGILNYLHAPVSADQLMLYARSIGD